MPACPPPITLKAQHQSRGSARTLLYLVPQSTRPLTTAAAARSTARPFSATLWTPGQSLQLSLCLEWSARHGCWTLHPQAFG